MPSKKFTRCADAISAPACCRRDTDSLDAHYFAGGGDAERVVGRRSVIDWRVHRPDCPGLDSRVGAAIIPGRRPYSQVGTSCCLSQNFVDGGGAERGGRGPGICGESQSAAPQLRADAWRDGSRRGTKECRPRQLRAARRRDAGPLEMGQAAACPYQVEEGSAHTTFWTNLHLKLGGLHFGPVSFTPPGPASSSLISCWKSSRERSDSRSPSVLMCARSL